jgi:hypothetical protein
LSPYPPGQVPPGQAANAQNYHFLQQQRLQQVCVFS